MGKLKKELKRHRWFRVLRLPYETYIKPYHRKLKKRWLGGDTRKAMKERAALVEEVSFLRQRLVDMEGIAFKAGAVPVRDPFHLLPPTGVDYASVIMPLVREEGISKQSRGRVLSNGFSNEQAFYIETECLARVQRVSQKKGYGRHFPELISVDVEHLRFTMSHCGVPLTKISHRVHVPSPDIQIAAIVDVLEEAGVCHFDINGNNITVNEEGVLALIDFDIACLDRYPLTHEIEKRLIDFDQSGQYSGVRASINKIVNDCPFIVPAMASYSSPQFQQRHWGNSDRLSASRRASRPDESVEYISR